ncbi:uncharacterized protein LOC142362287 isoform X1 [Opisthocomus hoazin]|uniref:uncharacterized protein LOC142362287 isoform X1 n=1 Tax=Opisthocomus hoazin TaxID=30419 RepID=UPI003F52F8B2
MRPPWLLHQRRACHLRRRGRGEEAKPHDARAKISRAVCTLPPCFPWHNGRAPSTSGTAPQLCPSSLWGLLQVPSRSVSLQGVPGTGRKALWRTRSSSGGPVAVRRVREMLCLKSNKQTHLTNCNRAAPAPSCSQDSAQDVQRFSTAHHPANHPEENSGAGLKELIQPDQERRRQWMLFLCTEDVLLRCAVARTKLLCIHSQSCPPE